MFEYVHDTGICGFIERFNQKPKTKPNQPDSIENTFIYECNESKTSIRTQPSRDARNRFMSLIKL